MDSEELRHWLADKLRASDLEIKEIAKLVDLTPSTIYAIMGERKNEIKLSTFINYTRL